MRVANSLRQTAVHPSANCGAKFIKKFINQAAHIEAQRFESKRRDQLLADFEAYLEKGGGGVGSWLQRYQLTWAKIEARQD